MSFTHALDVRHRARNCYAHIIPTPIGMFFAHFQLCLHQVILQLRFRNVRSCLFARNPGCGDGSDRYLEQLPLSERPSAHSRMSQTESPTDIQGVVEIPTQRRKFIPNPNHKPSKQHPLRKAFEKRRGIVPSSQNHWELISTKLGWVSYRRSCDDFVQADSARVRMIRK